MGGMAGKGTWVIVGGAATFVVTPLAVMAGSLTDDPVIPGSGVIVRGPRVVGLTARQEIPTATCPSTGCAR